MKSNFTHHSFPKAVSCLAGITLLAGCVTNPVKSGDVGAPEVGAAATWVAPARQVSAMETDGVWVNKRSVEVRESTLPAAFRQRLTMKLDVAMSLSQIAYAISRETGIRVSLASETRADAAKPITVAGHKLDAPLREVLDQLTAMANMAWRHRDGGIEIFRMDTQVFEIAAAPGASSFSHATTGINGAAGTDGASLNFWDALDRDLKSLVSPLGKVSVSEAARTVTVTDSLEGISAARAYVREMNARRNKQVALSVAVYSVETPAQGAMNWDALSKSLSKNGATSPAVLLTSAESTFGAILPAGFDGSETNRKALVSALQTLGKATVVTTSSRMVLNGEISPVSNLRTAGGVKEGVVMTMAPNVFGASTVNMTAAFDFAYSDAERSTRSFVEKFSVQSGQTYVFGFKHSDATAAMAGARGEPDRTIVVTITPTILAKQR